MGSSEPQKYGTPVQWPFGALGQRVLILRHPGLRQGRLRHSGQGGRGFALPHSSAVLQIVTDGCGRRTASLFLCSRQRARFHPGFRCVLPLPGVEPKGASVQECQGQWKRSPCFPGTVQGWAGAPEMAGIGPGSIDRAMAWCSTHCTLVRMSMWMSFLLLASGNTRLLRKT